MYTFVPTLPHAVARRGCWWSVRSKPTSPLEPGCQRCGTEKTTLYQLAVTFESQSWMKVKVVKWTGCQRCGTEETRSYIWYQEDQGWSIYSLERWQHQSPQSIPYKGGIFLMRWIPKEQKTLPMTQKSTKLLFGIVFRSKQSLSIPFKYFQGSNNLAISSPYDHNQSPQITWSVAFQPFLATT